jgi:phenylacetic acid degradation operon negative regulatory protein
VRARWAIGVANAAADPVNDMVTDAVAPALRAPRHALRPRSGTSAKALLLTVLGQFVAPRGGEVWTQTLIASLGAVGVEERNARQALSRLSEQGLVAGRREGRKVRRLLTPEAIDLLETGAQRIFGFGASADRWDGRWLVVLCSVPEEHRSKRHLLRSRLGFAGFGFLNAGVAITPHVEREPLATEILKDLDLVDNATVFLGEVGQLVTASDLLHRAWDMEALADEYRAFVQAFAGRTPATPRARFAALVDLVHRWRRFPFIDPELPNELLPSTWQGRRAREVFDERSAEWDDDASAYFEALEAAGAT